MAAVRPSKVTECGLEVPRRVVYQGWEPGGEYIKPLVMKNVQLQTQRIKYTIKGDQFHSAVYPQPIVLSAGMSYTLPIVFKPRKKEPCEQCIELETADGAVAVPLRAVLPHVSVSLPESLKFGLCAIQDSVSLEFLISNASNVGTQFSWECSSESCFTISPGTGELPPKTSCRVSATFSPESATVYSEVARCSYWSGGGGGGGGEEERQEGTAVELRGAGKYPHVAVRLPQSRSRVAKRGKKRRVEKNPLVDEVQGGEERGEVTAQSWRREVVVDFGSVAVGTSTQKWIELMNVSPVVANASIVPSNHSKLSPAHFTCTQSPSSLPPHSTHRIPLTFSPTLPSRHSALAFFEVRTQGGLSTTTIKCIGAAKAPRVVIEENVLDFGNLLCGESSAALLHVSNNSDVTALLQLQLEPGSVFRVDSTCIKLPPDSSHKIPIHFTPHKPVPHYKRIACLAQHQEPLFVHLIGTAYSETIRPVVLQLHLIKDYLSHGIPKHPPEEEDKLSVGRAHASPFTDYFHSQSGVSVDCEDIKFGCVSAGSVSDAKSLQVTNHTEESICCVWMTASCGIFSVTPEEKDIAPGTTCLFTVHFKPKHPGKFYCEELECYAFHKCLRDFQSVVVSGGGGGGDGVPVTLPWCLAVRAHGHSFQSNTHTFTPKMVFETRDIVFPASTPLEPVYRSVTVWNDGDTPALFDINPDPKRIFAIKPLSGLIPRGQYQTFVMEMVPREAKTYKHVALCLVNASPDHTQELLLSGTAELSPISLENQGRLFFKPTCVGSSSSVGYTITNTAHLPLKYEWKVSGEGSESVVVELTKGIILPSESQTHEWTFSPLQAVPVAVKAVLYTTSTSITTAIEEEAGRHSRRRRRHKAVLDLFGQGLLGEIQCHPSSLQFGTVTMGTSYTRTISLANRSLCTLSYSLSTLSREMEQAEENNSASHGVRLDPCEGVIHARSSQLVRVTVRPVKTTPYDCSIAYRLISTNPAVPHPAPTAVCGLELTGAYPSLLVTDVHGDRVAAGLSKARLWEMLSIDRLNDHLREEPAPSELRYAIATRHSMRRRVSVHTHAIEEFSFGAAPLDSGCSVVHLVLENRGSVESQWGFQFPSDMHLEPEYWADLGVLDETERHHHDVTTNKLFTVLPKTGMLAPGESVSITCSFTHTHIGSSRLPVLLKIHRGREILLNWSGVTVERGIPHVFFTSHHHCFRPMAIGGNAYPTQSYELHNMGEGAVTYQVDTAPLQALTSSNYLMPILQCLTTQGEIPPRGTASLPFIFSPLEAKKYSVDVPISFSTGESVLVTFSGEGLDPIPQSTDSAPSSSPMPIQPPSSSYPLTLPPGQLASLSTEHLSLGHLPLFSPVRRLVFLSNHHQSHSVSFIWTLTSAEAAAEVVSIHPAEGRIDPGKSCASRVTFYSQSSPAIYQLDITCKVVDEMEMTEYQVRLERWSARQEEKKHTFTISHPHKHIPDETIPKLQSTVCPGSLLNSDLRGSRYQVLPPIGAHPPTISYENWKRQDLSVKSKARPRAVKSSDEPPLPPTPLLLHLGVTAHTHTLADFSQTFGSLDKFYIAPQAQQLPSLQEGRNLHIKREERDLILSILGQMARELLDDGNFHAALERIQQEPVPSFSQLISSPSHNTAATQTVETAAAVSADSLSGGELESGEAAEREAGVSRGKEMVDGGEDETRQRQEGEVIKSGEISTTLERAPEVECMVESILESMLLGIVRESDAGEFNITSPHYLVAQYTTTSD